MRTLLTTLHSKFIHPSLALPCLAAYCGAECGDLEIREFTIHEPKESVLAALLAEQPDVIAFSVYLWNRRETLELVDALSVARPQLRLVLGGPEVSFAGPELFDQHPGLTALVRGEGELPLRQLLRAWQMNLAPGDIPRLLHRTGGSLVEGPDGPLLDPLDTLPSPFALGLVDQNRGFVYLETSRGCPYSCAFCMSALDSRVRSFSMERIHSDLSLLMEREVPKIKLVDRTFNYDAARARNIFQYILEHNRRSHFHFEIGAHLLDEATLRLLETVPEGMFQFEIGVQSTLPATLAAIGRKAPLDALAENVRRLRRKGNIHLHLDLITGLPGEGYADVLASIDRVATLAPHHLQIEPVKLLPGAPLRRQAAERGIRFDPNPPYTVLATPDLSFDQLEQLRGISRLCDLICNSGRFSGFLGGLTDRCGNLSAGLEKIEAFWRQAQLFRNPLSQRGVFEHIADFVQKEFTGEPRDELRDLLARDFAHSERVVPGSAPVFFDTDLSNQEQARIRQLAREEQDAIKGQGIKLQHFAAAFRYLPGSTERSVRIFLYLTETGKGMQVKELPLPADKSLSPPLG
ncbi:DUF4080 domain-containing protein [Trichloromonas sp.]|uniref:B12-binding domain-containing radical SAM protein n=1 Tax=Trichloromonas sp. TaxID=3069249 RepID=UPI003D817B31